MGCYPSCGIKPRLWNRIRYEVENISKMTYFIVVFDWSRFSIALFGLKSPPNKGGVRGVLKLLLLRGNLGLPIFK